MSDPIELISRFRDGCRRDAADEDLSPEIRARNEDAAKTLEVVLWQLRWPPSLEDQHRLKVAARAKAREA